MSITTGGDAVSAAVIRRRMWLRACIEITPFQCFRIYVDVFSRSVCVLSAGLSGFDRTIAHMYPVLFSHGKIRQGQGDGQPSPFLLCWGKNLGIRWELAVRKTEIVPCGRNNPNTTRCYSSNTAVSPLAKDYGRGYNNPVVRISSLCGQGTFVRIGHRERQLPMPTALIKFSSPPILRL